MVSHIVMWKFKDEIKADAFDLKMQFLHDKFVAMQGVSFYGLCSDKRIFNSPVMNSKKRDAF